MVEHFLVGFISAEATFTRTGPRFTFAVSLGAEDEALCVALAEFFGVGAIHRSARRRPHYQDEVSYRVTGAEQLAAVIVPFMDAHLPADAYKRAQYEQWREELAAHRRGRRRQPGGRPCSYEGCAAPARARGVCRHHYYADHGR